MPSLPPFLPRNLQTLATEIEEQRDRVRALEAAVAERRLLEEQRLMKIAAEKEGRKRRRRAEGVQRSELDRERMRALSIQQDDSVVRIGRARASRQCKLICCTRSGANHDSISKKSSVAETGNAEMTLECEHTCVESLFPVLREPSRDL
jgi:hypothetical protein